MTGVVWALAVVAFGVIITVAGVLVHRLVVGGVL